MEHLGRYFRSNAVSYMFGEGFVQAKRLYLVLANYYFYTTTNFDWSYLVEISHLCEFLFLKYNQYM